MAKRRLYIYNPCGHIYIYNPCGPTIKSFYQRSSESGITIMATALIFSKPTFKTFFHFNHSIFELHVMLMQK